MMWYGFGWMWLFGPLMMLVFWGAVVVLAVWVFSTLTGGPRGGQESALEILKRRLASGEITRDEYEQARKALEG